MKLNLFVVLLLSLTTLSQGALTFTGIGDIVIPTQVDLNAGIGGIDAASLASTNDGAISFAAAPSPNPSSAFTNLTITNDSAHSIGTWLVTLTTSDPNNAFPVFSDVIMTVSTGASSFQVPAPDGTYSFSLVNTIAPSASDTLSLSFSSSSPVPGPISFAFSTTAMSITAVVPEPSSALLLSGVLGLFGAGFRRRRAMPAE